MRDLKRETSEKREVGSWGPMGAFDPRETEVGRMRGGGGGSSGGSEEGDFRETGIGQLGSHGGFDPQETEVGRMRGVSLGSNGICDPLTKGGR